MSTGYFQDFRGVFDCREERLEDLRVRTRGGAETQLAPARTGTQVVLSGELLAPSRRPDRLDHEAVADCYARQGTAGLAGLNGSVAAMIWDADARALHFARDPAGTIPIYHHRSGPKLLFGTSLRWLEEHPLFERRLSPQGVGEFLFFLYLPAPASIWEDTWEVPAAACTSVRAEEVRTDYTPAILEEREPASLPEAMEVAVPVVQDAVERCLEPDRRSVLSMSGGIDSTLIATFASRAGRPLLGLTAAFGDPRRDESEGAAAIARHLGIEHRVVPVPNDRMVRELDRFYEIYEQPFADPATVAVMALVREAGLEGEVILDGSGADGLLGVPPPRFARYAAPWERVLPAGLRRALAAACERVPLTPFQRVSDVLGYEDYADLLANWRGWRRDALPRGCRIEESFWFRTYREWQDRLDLFGLYSTVYSSVWGPYAVIPQSARIGRSLGNVYRYPFEDHDFRQLIKRLPRAVKYDDTGTKVISRAILAQHMPRELFERKKQGFSPPLLGMLRADDHRLVRELIDLDVIRRQGILDPGPIRERRARFLAGDDRELTRMWSLVLLQLFLRERAKL